MKGQIPEKVLNKYQAKAPVGNPGVMRMIAVDTPNLSTQRQPSAAKLSKYLQRSNGFDWSLFGAVIAAEYPDGKMDLIDGGHRRTLLTSVYPEITHMPAVVVQVPDRPTASRLFHRFNGTSSSNVSNECRFVNEVLGEEVSKLNDNICKVLNDTGVTVYENEDCYVLTQNKTPKWKINLKAIEYMVKRDIPSATQALQLYTKAVAEKNGVQSVVNQLAKAFQQIFITYEEHFENPANLNSFQDFIIKKCDDTLPSNLLYKQYSHDRMELRHLGTAYGLVQDWRYAVNKNSKKGGITEPAVNDIKELYNSYLVK